MNSNRVTIAAAIGAMSSVAAADFTGLSSEFVQDFDTSTSLFGPDVGMVQVWRLYANFDDPDDVLVALGSTTVDPALEIHSASFDGTPGGSFWNHAPTPGFGPAAASDFAFTADQPGAEADTFLTIGAQAGWEPIANPNGSDFMPAQGTPGFAPDLSTTSIVINDGAWFVTPDNPFGMPDADGRVLLMQLAFPLDQMVVGTLNLSVVTNGMPGSPGDEGFNIVGQSFGINTPGPHVVGALILAGLIGRRRRD